MNLRFVLAAMLVCADVLSAQYAPQPDWNKPAAPHRVIGNVYYVGTNELSSVLITTPKGHILIDAALDESVPLIRDSIRKLGFKYEDVRVLLNTQAHYDHAAGLARIKRETGARVEAMGDDATLLAAGGKNDFRFGDELTFAAVKVDRVLKDGDIVEQGGVRVTTRHTPGHTKGSTTFLTTAEEGGQRYQVVFVASVAINPGTSLVGNPNYPHIVEDWEATYRLLKSLKPDVWVAGHTGAFDMAGKAPRIGSSPNPYIDREGYARYLDAGEKQFRKTLAEQQSSQK